MSPEELEKFLEMAKKEDEKVRKIKFRCLKTCGYVCCTKEELIVNPFSAHPEFILLALFAFPSYIPMLGAASRLPLLVKPHMEPCPFYDLKRGCTVYNVRPNPCRAYPAGIAQGPDEVYFGLPENHVCPEEAFGKGRKIGDIEKELLKIEFPPEDLAREWMETIPEMDFLTEMGFAAMLLIRMMENGRERALREFLKLVKEGNLPDTAASLTVLALICNMSPYPLEAIRQILNMHFKGAGDALTSIIAPFVNIEKPLDAVEKRNEILSKFADWLSSNQKNGA